MTSIKYVEFDNLGDRDSSSIDAEFSLVSTKPVPGRPIVELELVDLVDNSLSMLDAVMQFLSYLSNTGRDDIYQIISESGVLVYVDDKFIYPHDIRNVIITDTSLVVLTPDIQGIGDFLKKALGYILAAAAFVAAAWALISGHPELAVALFALGLGFISMQIAANMSFDLPIAGEQEETKSYTWSGIKTLVRDNVPKPIVIGTHKVGGYVIGLYTEAETPERNVLNMLILLSEGVCEGLCTEDDYDEVCLNSNPNNKYYKNPAIFINENPLSYFTGENEWSVRWWFRPGHNERGNLHFNSTNSQKPVPGFDQVRMQYDDGRTISYGDPVEYATKSDVTNLVITVSANGLFEYNRNNGKMEKRTVPFTLEYKLNAPGEEYKNFSEIAVYEDYEYRLCMMCKYFRIRKGNEIFCLMNKKPDWISCSNTDGNRRCPSGDNKFVSHINAGFEITEQIKNTGWGIIGETNVYERVTVSESIRPFMIDIKTQSLRVFHGNNVSGSWYVNEKNYWGCLNQHLSFYFDYTITYSDGSVENRRHIDTLEYNEDGYLVPHLSEYDEYDWYYDSSITRFYLPKTVNIEVPGYTLNLGSYYKVYPKTGVLSARPIEIKEFTAVINTVSILLSSEEVETPALELTGDTREKVSSVLRLDFGKENEGSYVIKLTRLIKDSNNLDINDECILDNVQEITDDELIYPNSALLGLKILANEKLSGNPPNVTAVVKGIKVPVFDHSPSTLSNCNMYYDTSSSTWKNLYDDKTVSVDTRYERMVEQYTENFGYHALNLLLNTRYGMGDFIKHWNINWSSLVELVQSCSRLNSAFESDNAIITWWDAGSDQQFTRKIRFPAYPSLVSKFPLDSNPNSLVDKSWQILDNVSRKVKIEDSSLWDENSYYDSYTDVPGNRPRYFMFSFPIEYKFQRKATYTLDIEIENFSSTTDLICELRVINSGLGKAYRYTKFTDLNYSILAPEFIDSVKFVHDDIDGFGITSPNLEFFTRTDNFHKSDQVLYFRRGMIAGISNDHILIKCSGARRCINVIYIEGLGIRRVTLMGTNVPDTDIDDFDHFDQSEDLYWSETFEDRGVNAGGDPIADRFYKCEFDNNKAYRYYRIDFYNTYTYSNYELYRNFNLDEDHQGHIFVYSLRCYGSADYEDSIAVNYVQVSDNKLSLTFWGRHYPINEMEIKIYRSHNRDLVGNITKVSIYSVSASTFFSANGVIEKEKKAEECLSELLMSCRSSLFSFGDKLMFNVNKNREPLEKISEYDIIDGSLNISSGDADVPGVIECQFSNADKLYEMDTRRKVIDGVDLNLNNVEKLGMKYIVDVYDIVRELNFYENVKKKLNEIIKFKMDMKGLVLFPTEIFYLQRSLPNNNKSTSSIITDFDSPTNVIIINPGIYIDDVTVSHTILYEMVNGGISHSTIDLSGVSVGDTITDIVVDTWGSDDPQIRSSVIIGYSSEVLKKFQVTNVSESENNTMEITAITYDPSIFIEGTVGLIENNIIGQDVLTSYIIHFEANQSFDESLGSGFNFKVQLSNTAGCSYVIQLRLYDRKGSKIHSFKTIYTSSDSDVPFLPYPVKDGYKYDFKLIVNKDGFGAIEKSHYSLFGKTSDVKFNLAPPDRISLDNVDKNDHYFDSMSFKIAWSPVKLSRDIMYEIRVGNSTSGKTKEEIWQNHVIISEMTANTSLTVNFQQIKNNVKLLYGNKNDVVENMYRVFVARIRTVFVGEPNSESAWSKHFIFENREPQILKNVTYKPTVSGVIFTWDDSLEPDHLYYALKEKIYNDEYGSTGVSWSGYINVEDNQYVRILTEDEIDTFGDDATIQIRVRDRDVFGQYGKETYVVGRCGILRDSVFVTKPSVSSGITGNVSELTDGTLNSGGVVIG